LLGDCLACVDQVVQWLDTIEQTEELPTTTCEEDADRIVARFGLSKEKTRVASGAQTATPDWIHGLLSRHSELGSNALTAIQYVPATDCFFHGEDPVALLTDLPGLLAFEAKGAMPWPPLASIDPFQCNLVLSALSRASAPSVSAHLHGRAGRCDIVALTEDHARSASGVLPERARAVLTEQLRLINESTSVDSPGHLSSAALVASHVLKYCGRNPDAEYFAQLAGEGNKVSLVSSFREGMARVLADKLATPGAAGSPTTGSLRADTTSRTLRIDATRIDALVRLTGELTVARNSLAHLMRSAYRDNNSMAASLKAQHATFEHLISDLQRSVLALRVLPMRVVFQRFPRLLRDMSDSLGKPVALKFVGEDTEADKRIIEMLFEPLLHVLRNAVDHGVENAAVRAERGKPRAATIELRAFRHADQVLVEIADDGSGLDTRRIREVAAERNIAAPDVLANMDDSDVVDLIFAPGFSTAAQVTALSGRGVGMDAVRTAVERVGGRVEIHSRPAQGTTVRFMLPFSVMMTTVMSVEAGGQMFGIPLDTVIETIRVPRNSIAAVGTARAVVVREQTIPVFDLAQMLGEQESRPTTGEAIIVITTFAGQRCGIDVESLGERLDIILKPLDGLLSGTPGITGTTLTGDGRVLLVLDVGELLQ
jgi:two-component system, chemotaxis family, sensor kinase CheA